MIEIRKISETAEFLRQQKSWSALLERSGQCEACLTHEWFQAWWKAFHEGNRLYILIAVTDGEPVGVAPLMACEGSFRDLRVRKICFMANGQSPSADFIVADDDKEQVLDSFIRYLLREADGWDILELQKICTGSQTLPHLQKVLAKKRLPFGFQESLKSPVIALTGDWEEFLSSRSRNFRKVLRNKLNRASRSGNISIERISDQAGIQQRLNDIFRISARSWKHKVGTAIPDSASSTTFYNETTTIMARKGWVELWLMRDGTRPIAFEYHIKYNGTSYPIRADYDEDYRDLSPGSVLEYHILKELFADPTVTKYNSCGHTYQYLLNWTSDLKEHLTVQVFNRRWFSRLLHGIEYGVIPLLRHTGAKQLYSWTLKRLRHTGDGTE